MQEMEKNLLSECRKKIFITSHNNGNTHLASAFSCLEIIYALYAKGVLKIDRNNPEWPLRDRFILSKGHAAIALYVILEELGILEGNELSTFLKPATRLAGEPCRRDLPWVEASTGSLGHGLSVGVGMALAQKMNGINAKTYVLLGDGECQEGSVWEAAMSAAAYHADNLVAILDCNRVQKMCTTQETMGVVEWKMKWQAFGWEVSEVDGHDTEALSQALSSISPNGKPHIVIANTVKGQGVSIMENDAKWHYKVPKKKEIKIIMDELGINAEELERCRERI